MKLGDLRKIEKRDKSADYARKWSFATTSKDSAMVKTSKSAQTLGKLSAEDSQKILKLDQELLDLAQKFQELMAKKEISTDDWTKIQELTSKIREKGELLNSFIRKITESLVHA